MPGDDDIVKVSGACPFCGKLFTAVAGEHIDGVLTHDWPPCVEFQVMEPGTYLGEVRKRREAGRAKA